MCCNPVLIKNNKKGVVSPYRDKRFMTVSCGHCPDCIKAKQQSYTTRAVLEFDNVLKSGGFAYFFTLTYNNNFLPLIDDVPVFSKIDVENYFKRVRINLERKLGWFKPLRYLCVSEYGGQTARPHYHIIFFFYHQIGTIFERTTFERIISDSWELGFTQSGKLNKGYLIDTKAIFYLLKYVGKDITFQSNYNRIVGSSSIFSKDNVKEILKRSRGFVKASKGLGLDYIDHITDDEWLKGVINYSADTTLFIPPYYYRHKFYDKTDVILPSGEKRVRFVPNEKGLDFQFKRYNFKHDSAKKDYENIVNTIEYIYNPKNSDKLELLNSVQSYKNFTTFNDVKQFFINEFPNIEYWFRYVNIIRGCHTPLLADEVQQIEIPTLDLYTFSTYFDYNEDTANFVLGDYSFSEYAHYINRYLEIHERAHEVAMLIVKLLKLNAYELKRRNFIKECADLDNKLTDYWKKQLNK